MKVYITVDMEGITGIVSRDQCNKDTQFYAEGCRLLTGDVNAAIDGALAGGATEIIVAERHGIFNIKHELVNPVAKVIYGATQGPRFPYLDGSIDCMFAVGYHAMAGTPDAVLEHTMSSTHYFDVKANGNSIGELAIDAGIAGLSGVPMVLATGDDKLCTEAEALIPGVATAEVKKGLGRHQALCLSPEEGQQRIRTAAKDAMGRIRDIKPVELGSPCELELTFKHTEFVDGYPMAGTNAYRKDGYTVVRTYDTIADWYGGVWIS